MGTVYQEPYLMSSAISLSWIGFKWTRIIYQVQYQKHLLTWQVWNTCMRILTQALLFIWLDCGFNLRTQMLIVLTVTATWTTTQSVVKFLWSSQICPNFFICEFIWNFISLFWFSLVNMEALLTWWRDSVQTFGY